MIQPVEAVRLLLLACPDFSDTLTRHRAWWGDEDPSLYTEMSVFAQYVVDCLQVNDTTSFPAVFHVIEQLLVEGDDATKGLMCVGFLESLQTIASNQLSDQDMYVRWLEPVSRSACLAIELQWQDKNSLADVIRDEVRRKGMAGS